MFTYMHKHRCREHIHMHTYAHICTHADMHMQRTLAHAHCCHIKSLLNPGVPIPHRSCKIPMSKRMVQIGVEECKEEEVQTGVEDLDSASDEPEQECKGEQ